MNRSLWLASILSIAVWASAIIIVATLSAPVMPRCEEDAVLIGQGTFEDGRWSSYICGPSADDYGIGG